MSEENNKSKKEGIRVFNPINPTPPKQQNNDANSVYNYGQNDLYSENLRLISTLNYFSREIGANNELLLRNVAGMIDQAERQNRKRKRKRIGQELQPNPNGVWSIAYIYDDETVDAKTFSRSLGGTFQVFSLQFEGQKDAGKFGIHLADSNLFVSGSKRKVRGDYLYTCFQRAGVVFEPGVPKAVVSACFNQFFAPLIETSPNVFTVPGLAGWHGKNFLHAGNFGWRKMSDFPDLPIFAKNFVAGPLTAQDREVYFRDLKMIKRLGDRIVLMLFPFAGLLSTLLKEAGFPISFFVNVVEMGGIRWCELCRVLQIFNRQNLFPCSLDISQKELENLLAGTRDEVLILDGTYAEEEDRYRREKLNGNGLKIANMLTGKSGRRPGARYEVGEAAVVLVSSRQNFGANIYSVFCDADFWCADFDDAVWRDGDPEGAVFRGFVGFCERNFDEVERIIRKKREEKDRRMLILEVVFEVLSAFWKSEGIDICEAAQLPPRNPLQYISFRPEETDELIEAFVQAVRHEIHKFRIGRERLFVKNKIYIADGWVCFPVAVFDRILGARSLYDKKSKILLALHNLSLLQKDNEGYSRKMCVDGNRFETYKIKEEIFQKVGDVSLEELGKEGYES